MVGRNRVAMIPTFLEREVLELLATDPALTSASAWKEALLSQNPSVSAREDADDASSRIIDVVKRILPSLPAFKPFHNRLCGLLGYCAQEASQDFFQLIEDWLSSSTISSAFREWLYEYIDIEGAWFLATNELRWKQVLILAAMREDKPELKWKLLNLIDRKVGSLEGVEAVSESATSVTQRLLTFCWHESVRLSASPALCAAKLAATLPATTNPMQWEQTLASLRWGCVLKPLLFQNVAKYLLTMKVISTTYESLLRVPEDVQKVARKSEVQRQHLLDQLIQHRQQLDGAFKKRVHHLRIASRRSYQVNIDVDRGLCRAAALRIAHDLTLVPSDLFPDVFAVYLVAMMRAVDGENCPASIDTLISLFSILELRSDDDSLLLLISAVIDLDVSKHAAWVSNAMVFVRTVERLSEMFIVETSAVKKWVLRIAIQQLVLECDTSFFRHAVYNHPELVDRYLPQDLRNSVVKRVADVNKVS